MNVCKGIGLAENTGETRYVEVGCHRVMMANEYITVCKNSYKKVKTFKYLGSLILLNIMFHAPMGRFQL
jgi:hypothetical protein